MSEKPLQIMVVEDETLLALDMKRTLNKLGHEVVGPFNTVETALSAVTADAPDLAFLDVNLGDGSNSLEIAEALDQRSVPFAFLTGYAASATVIGDAYPAVERVAKPCSPDALGNAVARLAQDHSANR